MYLYKNFLALILVSAIFSTELTFTNCGQEGQYGPTQDQCDDEYYGTDLDGEVLLNNGIQEWVVPGDGIYRIEVFGAQGGSGFYQGGFGAYTSGDFDLTGGQTIRILVGQQGDASGGGGGTFVADGNTPLIVSGGGAGSGYYEESGEGRIDFGGVGEGGAADSDGCGSSGGGGFFGDGESDPNSSGGIAFVNGGFGGDGAECSELGPNWGGFGAGAGSGHPDNPAGGGGYNGGYGRHYTDGPGQGGSSYNDGANQDNFPGYNEGHGYVVISYEGLSNSGDLTGDGEINIYDIILLINLVFDGEYNSEGDLNGDGILNIADCILLVNFILDN